MLKKGVLAKNRVSTKMGLSQPAFPDAQMCFFVANINKLLMSLTVSHRDAL